MNDGKHINMAHLVKNDAKDLRCTFIRLLLHHFSEKDKSPPVCGFLKDVPVQKNMYFFLINIMNLLKAMPIEPKNNESDGTMN